MTKRAFIWDLDGTLLDSYNAILAGLEETYATYQLPFDRASINDFILKHSVQSSPSRKSSREKCPGPSDGWGA